MVEVWEYVGYVGGKKGTVGMPEGERSISKDSIELSFRVALVAQVVSNSCDLMDCSLSGKNIGVGSHFLLQGIFPIHGSNLNLQHCRQIF